METLVLTVEPQHENERADKYIADNAPDLTRSAVQKLIGSGNITVNGNALKSNYKVKSGDSISITIPDPQDISIKAENIPLDIVYEDEYLLVVNKPKGMVVHPAVGNYSGTLVNALMYHCKDSLSGINGEIRPGIVHRIDKNTSGLLIVAKNDFAHVRLAAQIKEHSFTREYQAVVHGGFKQDEGTIDAPIGRHPVERKKMAVTIKNSKNAVTHYKVIARYGDFTHLCLKLETGRTHQIRVHMAYIGHPVAGDDVYMKGKSDKGLVGQCLHAYKIGFVHPKTGEYLEFTSPLPDCFVSFIDKIKQN